MQDCLLAKAYLGVMEMNTFFILKDIPQRKRESSHREQVEVSFISVNHIKNSLADFI